MPVIEHHMHRTPPAHPNLPLTPNLTLDLVT